MVFLCSELHTQRCCIDWTSCLLLCIWGTSHNHMHPQLGCKFVYPCLLETACRALVALWLLLFVLPGNQCVTECYGWSDGSHSIMSPVLGVQWKQNWGELWWCAVRWWDMARLIDHMCIWVFTFTHTHAHTHAHTYAVMHLCIYVCCAYVHAYVCVIQL